MTAFLILAIVSVWFFLAAVFVVTASMMSARISHLEEESSRAAETETVSAVPLRPARTIPTQPRATALR